MKKSIAIAFFGVLVLASCSKKEAGYEKDSNVMLEEPKVEEVDSVVTETPADGTAVDMPVAAPVAADSLTAK